MVGKKLSLVIKCAGAATLLAALYGLYRALPTLEYLAAKPMSGDVICRGGSDGSESRFFSALTAEPVTSCGIVLSHRWRWYVLDFNDRAKLVPIAIWTLKQSAFTVLRPAEATSGMAVTLRNSFVELEHKPNNPPVFYGAAEISRRYPVKIGTETVIDEQDSARLEAAGFAAAPGIKVITPASLAKSATLEEVFTTGIETGRIKRR